jgi:hypothetical protein
LNRERAEACMQLVAATISTKPVNADLKTEERDETFSAMGQQRREMGLQGQEFDAKSLVKFQQNS